jgi:uncharacterized membrane protein YcaP (DUF421 family)
VARVDWSAMFTSNINVGEMVLRGSVFLALFVMLRVIRKRQASQVGVTDLLVLVLIADAAQNAMASEYRSITDGLILVATIILWSLILDSAGYPWPAIGRFAYPPPLPLIADGRIIRQNMRKEQISEEEFLGQLREQGVDDISEVKAAYMEGDGQITVIEKKKGNGRSRQTGPI